MIEPAHDQRGSRRRLVADFRIETLAGGDIAREILCAGQIAAHEGDILPARADKHLSDIGEDEVDLAFEIADHLLTVGINGRLTADMDHTIAGLDDGDVRKARRRRRRAQDVELLDRCGHGSLLVWKGWRSHWS